MTYAIATEEKETYLIDRGSIPVPIHVEKVVRGVFLELGTSGSVYYYGRTSRDTSGWYPAGVTMETKDNSTGAKGDLTIRVCPSGIGVFPISRVTAALPGTDLYVDAAVDGNTLTDVAGNNKVGTTIYPCKKTGEPDATATSYAWVHINCMMP